MRREYTPTERGGDAMEKQISARERVTGSRVAFTCKWLKNWIKRYEDVKPSAGVLEHETRWTVHVYLCVCIMWGAEGWRDLLYSRCWPFHACQPLLAQSVYIKIRISLYRSAPHHHLKSFHISHVIVTITNLIGPCQQSASMLCLLKTAFTLTRAACLSHLITANKFSSHLTLLLLLSPWVRQE